MPLIPIFGLGNLLSQVNGAQSPNSTASPTQSGKANSNVALISAFDNLIQQLATAPGAPASPAIASATSSPSAAGGMVSTSGPTGVDATSTVANLEATLNQLLQNLKLSAVGASDAAGSTAAAQGSGAPHQLLGRVRQLAQQTSHQYVGRMLAVA